MKQTAHRKKVLAFLENHWATVSQVALLLGLNDWGAYCVLIRMEKAGKAKRDKDRRPHLWTAENIEVPRKWSPRQAALRAGEKVYEGVPCRYGHPGIRYTRSGTCKLCANQSAIKEAA